MALLARGSMGGTAAAAVAAATWFAAAAQRSDGWLAVLGVALLAGVAGAAVRRSTSVLAPGQDVVVLTAVTVGGLFVLSLAGWTDRAHQDEVARLLPWAVVVLGVLWPEPNVLRYCLLLAAGALLGAALTGDTAPERWAVGGSLVSMAVALVATNRLTAARGPRLGGPAPTRGRRVAAEAAAVLAVVGLLAALAASLVPPPSGQGGGGGGGGAGGSALLQPAAPGVDFDDRLDVGAGRARRGNEVVFLIDAPAPDVWRATTYDHWDGESWERAPDAPVEVEGRLRPGLGDVPDGDGLEFPQRVTVQARFASVLVAAARPTFLGVDGLVGQSVDGTLRPEFPLQRGEVYVVYSDRWYAGREALRAAAGAVPTDVADRYLQLPQVPPGVRALAAEITADEPTTYDQVRALEAWLLDNTTVTEDARPVPPGADPLGTFLLDDRSGPPERTATALAVMLRALGVPTRIAVGFLPGSRTGPDGEFAVRLRDTHAWVEVWFPGIGWQRFDPTGKAPPPEPENESVWDRLWRFLRRLWPLAVALIAVALGWLAWRGLRWWRRRQSLPWGIRFLARLERAGTARGRPRRPQETPSEYAGELSRSVLPHPRLEEVGELVTVAAYSRREPPADERARAEDVLRAATRAAPARRSFMAALRRRSRVHRPPAPPRPTIRKP